MPTTKDFTATVKQDTERGKEWLSILGTTTIPIKSPFSVPASLPGIPNARIYMLDLDSLDEPQTTRLIAHLSQKFNIPEAEIRAQLPQHGVPILANDITVTIRNPQRWF